MATLGQVRASYRETPLWQALAEMRIEPEGAAATFARRLGRKQGWGKRRTFAVIEEYRRFLYLAATGDRPVTPSDDIDEAWHLHLTYTRHYWDELCGRILGKPLHHDPTEGGAGQQAHFKEQYAATLARYEVVFGEPPRPDVWPPPAAQFAPPRPRLLPRIGATVASVGVATCAALSNHLGGGGGGGCGVGGCSGGCGGGCGGCGG